MPEIIKSLAPEVYHARDEISVHGLGTFAQCPKKYEWQKSNPPKQTDSMWWGQVIHTAVLEPCSFFETYAQASVKRTAKKAWAEEEAAAAGKILLTEEEVAEATAIAREVRLHPTVNKLFSSPHHLAPPETSFFWEDPETGVKCRARMDFNTSCGIVCDLKTTQNASPDAFSREIYNFRYHVQAAFYLWGAQHCGVKADNFVFIAVEKSQPYLLALYVADQSMLELGHATFRRELNEFAECKKTGEFPGYPNSIQSISLPSYAK